MDTALTFFEVALNSLQSPSLGFLLGGVLVAALGGRLDIPDALYRFIVFALLMRIGLNAGMEMRDARLQDIFLPALLAAILGAAIVLLGRFSLALLPGIRHEDAFATAGLFGAVSSATLAAAMQHLDASAIHYEAWVAALYPFMDIPALLAAIILAKMTRDKRQQLSIRAIVVDSLRGSAITALLLGMLLGLLTNSEKVFEGFYNQLFYGFLSILMLVMGMEAWSRLSELRRVAHWYAVYALIAPIAHGFLGFALGYVAHITTGFSPGGVVILAVMAASSSDISGPPTLRAAIPSANPSTYIGSSTGIGTPVAIGIGIPLFTELGRLVFHL